MIYAPYFACIISNDTLDNRCRLACAYYDPVKRFVYVLEDTEENVHLDLTKMRESFFSVPTGFDAIDSFAVSERTVFEQTSPDAIITSSRADDGFITVCQKYGTSSLTFLHLNAYMRSFRPNFVLYQH